MRTAAEMWIYINTATKGSWTTGPEGAYWPIAKHDPDMPGVCKYEDLLCGVNAEADAEFCINARKDLPRLLVDAQALREALRKLAFDNAEGDCLNEVLAIYERTAYLADGFRADLLPESDDDTPHDVIGG